MSNEHYYLKKNKKHSHTFNFTHFTKPLNTKCFIYILQEQIYLSPIQQLDQCRFNAHVTWHSNASMLVAASASTKLVQH